MSDLFCPATVLVARHGNASYVETWFSDEGGWLSPEGRDQAHALAEQVRPRKVARVWSSDTSRAVQTAEIVAARLGLAHGMAVTAHKTLREIHAGDLTGQPFDVRRLHAVTDHWFAGELTHRFSGGESGAEVIQRYREELDAIADEHRGETVLVVVHQIAASIALPTLCGLPLSVGRENPLSNGEYAELTRDADGWRLVAWGDQD